MKKSKLKTVEAPEIIKLDLGCGPNKQAGFTGIDALPFDGKVDKVLDLRATPWPWKDDSVDEVYSSHFVEHLSGEERVPFFNELYRVLRKDAKATIVVPAWNSERAYGDPTHKWPPVCGFSFFYLDKNWRASNAPHCGYTCDFNFTGGNSLAPPWNMKSQEVQAFAQTHYVNVAQDIVCTLIKR
jgi:SAM-dependent methyltransferase